MDLEATRKEHKTGPGPRSLCAASGVTAGGIVDITLAIAQVPVREKSSDVTGGGYHLTLESATSFTGYTVALDSPQCAETVRLKQGPTKPIKDGCISEWIKNLRMADHSGQNA